MTETIPASGCQVCGCNPPIGCGTRIGYGGVTATAPAVLNESRLCEDCYDLGRDLARQDQVMPDGRTRLEALAELLGINVYPDPETWPTDHQPTTSTSKRKAHHR